MHKKHDDAPKRAHPDHYRQELAALEEVRAALAKANATIGRRAVYGLLPGSEESLQVGRFQRKLGDLIAELRLMQMDALKNLPREPAPVAREFHSTGALGATYTGD